MFKLANERGTIHGPADRRIRPSRGHLALLVLAGAVGASPQGAAQSVAYDPPIALTAAPVNTIGQAGITVARAQNGTSLAVWSDDRTGDHDVYGALFDANGVLRSPIGGFKIVGFLGTPEGDPRVAACGNVFLVVWGNGITDMLSSGDIDIPINDLYATRVDSAGTILDATPIVIAAQPYKEHNVRISESDGVDTFMVAFRTTGETIFGGINFMRVSAATGATLDPPGGVVFSPGGIGYFKKNPSVAFGADRFFITWDDGRDFCHYAGESGCIDIYGAFVDPATGSAIGPQFATTSAFSCQEGSRSKFNGSHFLVVHNDERITNCSTSDFTGERVTPDGVVLDSVDGTGLVGGLWIASDPPGSPGTTQLGVVMAADACGSVVTYLDAAVPPPLLARRMKRIDGDGRLEFGDSPGRPGSLVALGASGTRPALEGVALGKFRYLLAYTLGNQPFVRVARFLTPFLRLIIANQLKRPRGVAVAAQGDIVVADTGNNRVRVFDAEGVLKFQFGALGSAAGQFRNPFGVAIGANGDVYVADTGNNRVQVFGATGNFKFQFGGFGTANGRFRQPLGIAVGTSGDVLVADTSNDRVQVFTASGAFKFKFGSPGSLPGQFKAARAVAQDAFGRIYVADRDNNRVQVFTATGVFSSVIQGSLRRPRGVAVDGAGKIFVADSENDRIVVFSPQGQIYYPFGKAGKASGQFNTATAVALDAKGNSYVADYRNDRIQVFGCVP